MVLRWSRISKRSSSGMPSSDAFSGSMTGNFCLGQYIVCVSGSWCRASYGKSHGSRLDRGLIKELVCERKNE